MEKEKLMQQIEKNVISCKECRLHQQAKNAVPGEGNISSPLIFIGEAPGANEDATGRPFVGRAGNLLEKLLAKIGYTREQVWIGNIIKHRPPGNRDPTPDEIKSCSPYLSLQLKTMEPKLIVTLGRFAMHYFYKEGTISKNRGNLLRTNLYNIYPVYHPAAGLRNSGMLRALEEDFMKIPTVLKSIEEKSNKFVVNQDVDDDQLSLF